MATKSKNARRVEEEFEAYGPDETPKRDLKVLVFGIWFVIVFGLLGLFLLTTSPNSDTGGQGAPAPAPGATEPGVGADKQKELADRVKALNDRLGKNPKDIGARVELGFAFYEGAQFQDAAASFQQAVNTAPENIDGLVGLGMSYQALNRHNEALASYDKALSVDPQNDFAKVRKAYFLDDVKNDQEGALKLLREVEAKQSLGNIKSQLKQAIQEIENRRK